MSKAEDRANEIYRGDTPITRLRRKDYCDGYHQAEKDLIDKTLDFLKDKLYEKGYVGIIDLCDDYIKAMKDE